MCLLMTLNDEKLNYVKEPVAIIDKKEKQLRNQVIKQVKVHWRHRRVPRLLGNPRRR
jgi:hypothetical protein